jgi:hypothetical protein
MAGAFLKMAATAAAGTESVAPQGSELAYRHTVASDDEGLSLVEPAHDLAALVAELALGDGFSHFPRVAHRATAVDGSQRATVDSPPCLHYPQPTTMEPQTTAGHRFSEGRARFNHAASIFLILCGLNGSAYLYSLNKAISSGTPVSIYESYDPNVLSLKGKHARVEPAVYGKLKTYGNITSVLFAAGFALTLFLIVLNARLPASTAPDPLDELGPIRIAGDGVAHSGGVQSPVILPRSRIESLELQYTPGMERPGGGIVLGAFFLLAGLPLAGFLLPRIQDLEMFFASCLGLLLAGTGAWILWFSIRKRYVLVAHTPNGSSRMIFHRTATREEVILFATSAARRHGYPFDFGHGLIG